MSYVDDAFYEKLLKDFSGWDEKILKDPLLREECRALLEREARLLDQGRLEDWLALYAEKCVVWVPATPRPGDPRREATVYFDDRKRLEDRIFRLRTGSAWSQVPPSRTVRLVSNVEVFEGLMVRSNFFVSEFRAGETRALAGWCAHRLAREAGGLRIEAKQVNLLECDQNLRNLSILL
jgi:benzoate/toluate 1,2-dioxygenase beta subunit